MQPSIKIFPSRRKDYGEGVIFIKVQRLVSLFVINKGSYLKTLQLNILFSWWHSLDHFIKMGVKEF